MVEDVQHKKPKNMEDVKYKTNVSSFITL